jgi:hypothetical protein
METGVGGEFMSKLTIAFFASVLAIASAPAFAADLPDYGSKNFSAPDDTPTHFVNEDLPVSARTADATERDWSAVDAIAPDRPARSAYRSAGRYGRYGFAHGSVRHTTNGSAARAHGTKTWSVHYSAASTRPAGAARTMTAKHGKPGARHASAAAHDGTM